MASFFKSLIDRFRDRQTGQKPTKPIGGKIAYFQLEAWWLSTFTEDERKYIQRQCAVEPVSEVAGVFLPDDLTTGDIVNTSQSAVEMLTMLARGLDAPKDRAIAERVYDKALELAHGGDILDAHFLYGQMIKTLYRLREQPGYPEKAIDACQRQISIAKEAAKAFRIEYPDSPQLPSHRGFNQLAIVLEKQRKFQEAIELAQQAATQGWPGDWQRRIERCRARAKKV